jgi:cysteinyl-tRNA synthetase
MSEIYLGLPMDIHGGGQDLAFPHHENERAQSEAATGKTFVKYWLHNGFVRVKSEKMSKSLGNFITIRDILQDYRPEVLRFFLLGKHYRSPLDFSWENLQETERSLKRLLQTRLQTELALQNQNWSTQNLPPDMAAEFQSAADLWRKCLEDDLNTAGALGHLFSQNRLINRLLDQKQLRKSEEGRRVLSAFVHELDQLAQILGLPLGDPRTMLTELRRSKAQRNQISIETVEQLIAERQKARQTKDFEQADAIRDQLSAMGVSLMDTPEGPDWDVD